MPKPKNKGYVSDKVGKVSEQRIPKGFRLQAQSARLAIDEIGWSGRRAYKNKSLSPLQSFGVRSERLRVKAAKKRVKLSSDEAEGLVSKANKKAFVASKAIKGPNPGFSKLGTLARRFGKSALVLGVLEGMRSK